VGAIRERGRRAHWSRWRRALCWSEIELSYEFTLSLSIDLYLIHLSTNSFLYWICSTTRWWCAAQVLNGLKMSGVAVIKIPLLHMQRPFNPRCIFSLACIVILATLLTHLSLSSHNSVRCSRCQSKFDARLRANESVSMSCDKCGADVTARSPSHFSHIPHLTQSYTNNQKNRLNILSHFFVPLTISSREQAVALNDARIQQQHCNNTVTRLYQHCNNTVTTL
jgi:hypothetical protein